MENTFYITTEHFKVRPLKINGLFLVQNFLELDARVKTKQAGKRQCANRAYPADKFGTVVGENPTPYGNLALWAVNGLSIVCWVGLVQIYTSE